MEAQVGEQEARQQTPDRPPGHVPLPVVQSADELLADPVRPTRDRTIRNAQIPLAPESEEDGASADEPHVRPHQVKTCCRDADEGVDDEPAKALAALAPHDFHCGMILLTVRRRVPTTPRGIRQHDHAHADANEHIAHGSCHLVRHGDQRIVPKLHGLPCVNRVEMPGPEVEGGDRDARLRKEEEWNHVLQVVRPVQGETKA
eukprot:scaffold8458_cov267-Pinguiococcus_pyrenoidosus.AAC.1